MIWDYERYKNIVCNCGRRFFRFILTVDFLKICFFLPKNHTELSVMIRISKLQSHFKYIRGQVGPFRDTQKCPKIYKQFLERFYDSKTSIIIAGMFFN